MDEFHLLLKEEQTAAYSVEIWKRFRKWGGIPTCLLYTSGVIVNLHIRSIDQSEAIKTIKRKITDLDKMKIEEQKKAVRSGCLLYTSILYLDIPNKFFNNVSKSN